MNVGDGLTGKRVFVVEDEFLVTLLIEDTLADIGCEVAGVASRFQEAMDQAAALSFDVAILDVDLAGTQTFPIAEALAARGLPFVFATGYGSSTMPRPFKGVPVLRKPFMPLDLEEALGAALK